MKGACVKGLVCSMCWSLQSEPSRGRWSEGWTVKYRWDGKCGCRNIFSFVKRDEMYGGD